jgi:3-oxo-5alpha-steroid 4-dehydrogenase
MTRTSTAAWDYETDVVVVGLGGAGACAAIEALQRGVSVTLLERFVGGGATAISGGVVYAGGGTGVQLQAGVEDDVEAMSAYLSEEIGAVVSEKTLDEFCRGSAEELRWLEALGLHFEASLCPDKTSYPNDDYFLYYSGNEAAEPWRSLARPAPRGHRVKGRGLPGRNFFDPLHQEVRRLGADVQLHSRARELITNDAGVVIGVAYQQILPGFWARLHGGIEALASRVALFLPWAARALRRLGCQLEARRGRPLKIAARFGVVLTTGGFINNAQMVEKYAPAYRSGLPIGTAGCSGDGIRMGQAAGARLEHMHNISAWLFLNPPRAFVQGMLIDRQGKRFVNEALYGAVVGGRMVETSGGVGFLVIDSALKAQARSQIGGGQTQTFQTYPALLNLLLNCRRADDVDALARICRCDARVLEETLATYNEATRSGSPDAFRKQERAVLRPPFYVLDCSADNRLFPLMTLTLGGLAVDEETGAVCREDRTVIPGLFAAGRAAVGLCSRNYVSGLSLADCVYSGRRAGRSAARTSRDGEARRLRRLSD